MKTWKVEVPSRETLYVEIESDTFPTPTEINYKLQMGEYESGVKQFDIAKVEISLKAEATNES